MSAGAPVRLTSGYAQIPNSVIENQGVLTRAELALTLIVLRRGGAQENGVLVSDRNWQSWTGLSPRLKEYAVAGLRKKGVSMMGRGDSARYRFEHRSWETFVVEHGTTGADRPRTAGRKNGVSPKAGAKIHPACRERGCAMLAADGNGGLTLVPGSSNAQPVARSIGSTPGKTPLPLTPVAQPVARSSASAPGRTAVSGGVGSVSAAAWAGTLAALKEFFPLVGLAFLARLVAVVSAVFAGLTDTELAKGVRLAWSFTKNRQKTEGLFLFTVPDAVRLIREKGSGGESAGEVRKHLLSCAELLRKRGAPFLELAEEVYGVAVDPAPLDLGNLRRIDHQVFKAAWLLLAGPRQLEIINTARADWPNDADLRQKAERVETLLALDLPPIFGWDI